MQNKKKKKKKNELRKNKRNIHTTISAEIFKIIEELAKEKNKTKGKIIEEAVTTLVRVEKPIEEEGQKIWNRAKNELKMFLVDKTTFMSYLSGETEKAWEENIATEVIEWITGKNILELSLLETINAIKKMWKAANYFTEISVRIISENNYEIKFQHTLNRKYSEFWANYFKMWFENNKECNVDFLIRNEAFILIIRF